MLTRDEFLIRDDIIFFNHGSFGACPKSVFERYQAWQLELERQPIDFLLRRGAQLMGDARSRIASYFNVPADEIVFVTNVTSGLSRAVRSLRLNPGDEILTTNHEYGAVNRLLEFVALKTGARYRPQVKCICRTSQTTPLPMPCSPKPRQTPKRSSSATSHPQHPLSSRWN